MSKDPAVLFYTSDFLTGTATMTNEEVGMYIRLLCIQHQKYKLSEKDMLFICQRQNEDIFEKFQKDEEGYYFNARMRTECEKRQNYSESRRKNRKKKEIEEDMNNTSLTHDKHVENENENNKDLESVKLEIVDNKSSKKENLKKEKGEFEILPQEKSEAFLKFEAWVLKDAPRVAKMKEPITQEQFDKLISKHKKELIMDTVLSMQNWADLLKKNISTYLTITKWINKANKESDQTETVEKLSSPRRAFVE